MHLKMHLRVPILKMFIHFEKHLYVSKGNRYLRQSGCSFSFSVPSVREIEKLAGYITKSILAKLKCNVCETLLKSNKITSKYIKIMSHGGLTEPSQSLADYVCAGFAILDTRKYLLLQYSDIRKQVSLLTLELFHANPFMGYDHQE